MRVRSLLLASMVAIALPTIAVAQDAPAGQPKPVKEKKICRRDGPTTGSIMAARPVCHTKAEWTKIDEQNRRGTEAILGQPNPNVMSR